MLLLFFQEIFLDLCELYDDIMNKSMNSIKTDQKLLHFLILKKGFDFKCAFSEMMVVSGN